MQEEWKVTGFVQVQSSGYELRMLQEDLTFITQD